jgi:dienelactone hydrolase
MKEQVIKYNHGSVECKGFLVYDESIRTPQPAVLVVHTWRGLDDFTKDKARELAKLGYIGFAVDMFGNGKTAPDDQEATLLITPFFQDRKLMRERAIAAFNTITQNPLVDKARVGAIGFCFGGTTVVELLGGGTPIKSAVAFHGAFNQPISPIAKNVKGSLLILHGFEDPLSTPENMQRLQTELNQTEIDWELDIYGHASHAFTNPVANDKEKGLIYEPKANQRSWRAMKNHFEETL